MQYFDGFIVLIPNDDNPHDSSQNPNEWYHENQQTIGVILIIDHPNWLPTNSCFYQQSMTIHYQVIDYQLIDCLSFSWMVFFRWFSSAIIGAGPQEDRAPSADAPKSPWKDVKMYLSTQKSEWLRMVMVSDVEWWLIDGSWWLDMVVDGLMNSSLICSGSLWFRGSWWLILYCYKSSGWQWFSVKWWYSWQPAAWSCAQNLW